VSDLVKRNRDSPLAKEIYLGLWLRAGWNGLSSLELHENISNRGSSIGSAGLSHAEMLEDGWSTLSLHACRQRASGPLAVFV